MGFSTTGRFLAFGILLALACAGCSQFRGIPSHGGGKRFDEEQRAMAGSIRRTISCMDLKELRGKRTGIVVSNLYTSGSGTANFGGLQDVGASVTRSLASTRLVRTVPPGTSLRDETEWENDSGNVNGRFRPYSTYYPASHHTEGDMNYFRASLEMKARHVGLNIVTQKPDTLLYVLVDVLGTNRSRRDLIVFAREELLACCEVTYYALDVKSGKLIFKARQTGSAARYLEDKIFFVPHAVVSRRLDYRKPVYFDTAEVRLPNGSAAEVPEDLGEVKRISKQMKPRQREKLLEELANRVRYHVKSGDARGAGDHVQAIREIDPGYHGLAELAEEIKDLKPPKQEK